MNKFLSLFIINQFNWIHLIILAFYPLFIVASYFIFKNKDERTKNCYMWILMIIAFVITWLVFITDFFFNEKHVPEIWKRLPLHMCSINVILYPLFFSLRKHKWPFLVSTLLAYMYFIGSPGALLGLILPPGDGDCIDGVSIFKYNVFVYYIKHGLIFSIPIIMIVLGYYRPKWKDIFKAVGFLFIFLFIMYGVNYFFYLVSKLQIEGGYWPNYFYIIDGSSTPVLSTFWNLNPKPLIYLFPLVMVAVIIFFIYYLPFMIMSLGKRYCLCKGK